MAQSRWDVIRNNVLCCWSGFLIPAHLAIPIPIPGLHYIQPHPHRITRKKQVNGIRIPDADIPANKAACRAGFWPSDVWSTLPMYTSVTSSFSIPSTQYQSTVFDRVLIHLKTPYYIRLCMNHARFVKKNSLSVVPRLSVCLSAVRTFICSVPPSIV